MLRKGKGENWIDVIKHAEQGDAREAFKSEVDGGQSCFSPLTINASAEERGSGERRYHSPVARARSIGGSNDPHWAVDSVEYETRHPVSLPRERHRAP